MSSAETAASILKQLSEEEVRALALLGSQLERFEIYPSDLLEHQAEWSQQYLKEVMLSLQQKDLVNTTQVPYDGYSLRGAGLDALALITLASSDVVTHMGRRIGVGKESDLFEGLGPDGEKVSLKFFRIGRTSFTDVLRKRRYVPSGRGASWFVRSITAAGREFQALAYLHARGVAVPGPIARERHVVVMEYLDGEIVAEAKEVLNPDLVLDAALEIVRAAYREGYVNGDLSTYNLFVTRDERVLIIDWPQWTPKDQKGSTERLKEDLTNLTTWFERKYGIRREVETMLRSVVDPS